MQLSDSISQSTQQRVSILDNDSLIVLFDSIHPMRLAINEGKRATKYAVEDGTERSDHVVTELIEMQLDLTITEEVRNTFENVRQAFLDNTLVTIQTKVTSYENMLIVDCSHDEIVDLGEAINIAMRLQQWQSVEPEFGELPQRQVVNPAQSSTTQRGQQSTSPVEAAETERRQSILYGIFN